MFCFFFYNFRVFFIFDLLFTMSLTNLFYFYLTDSRKERTWCPFDRSKLIWVVFPKTPKAWFIIAIFGIIFKLQVNCEVFKNTFFFLSTTGWKLHNWILQMMQIWMPSYQLVSTFGVTEINLHNFNINFHESYLCYSILYKYAVFTNKFSRYQDFPSIFLLIRCVNIYFTKNLQTRKSSLFLVLFRRRGRYLWLHVFFYRRQL